MERRPALLGGLYNGSFANGAQLPFALPGLGRGGWRRPFGRSPPLPLGVTDTLPGGGAHLPPPAFWNIRRGSGLHGTTMEHLAEFGDLDRKSTRLNSSHL